MDRQLPIPDYPPSFNTVEPAANISMSDTTRNLTSTYVYDVRIPEEYQNDFVVQIKASDLRKIRRILLQAKENKFPLSEMLLGLSTTGLGCVIGALCSGVRVDTLIGILAYCIVPACGVGAFIAYLFVRKKVINDANSIADQALEILADPDNCKEIV